MKMLTVASVAGVAMKVRTALRLAIRSTAGATGFGAVGFGWGLCLARYVGEWTKTGFGCGVGCEAASRLLRRPAEQQQQC